MASSRLMVAVLASVAIVGATLPTLAQAVNALDLNALVNQACPHDRADVRCAQLRKDMKAMQQSGTIPVASFKPREIPYPLLASDPDAIRLIRETYPAALPADLPSETIQSFATMEEFRSLLPFPADYDEKWTRLEEVLTTSLTADSKLALAAKSIQAFPQNGWGLFNFLAGKWFSQNDPRFCIKGDMTRFADNMCWLHVYWQDGQNILRRDWHNQDGSIAASDLLARGSGGTLTGFRIWISGQRSELSISVPTAYSFEEDGQRFIFGSVSLYTDTVSGSKFPVSWFFQNKPGTRLDFFSSPEDKVQATFASRNHEEAMYNARQAQREKERAHDAAMSLLLGTLRSTANTLQDQAGVGRGNLEQSIAEGMRSGKTIAQSPSGDGPTAGSAASQRADAGTQSAPPQAPAQPAFQPSSPTESTCSYWHRHRAGDREYEQCSPGDKDCTCADAAKVSGQ